MDQETLNKAGMEILQSHKRTHEVELPYRGEKYKFVFKKDTIHDNMVIFAKVRKYIEGLMKEGTCPEDTSNLENLLNIIFTVDTLLVERPKFLENILEFDDIDFIITLYGELSRFLASFRSAK
jgi:hypothetical protein